MSGDTCIAKEPCPKCGSTDNLARYDDGHAHCFTPGCEYWEGADSEDFTKGATTAKPKGGLIADWEVQAISKRNLSEDTCKKWKYGIADYKGKKVQVANYFRDGALVAQKVRFPQKDFVMLGDGKNAPLFGQHLWRDGGRFLTITEGEIDAMSVSQILGHKWPVVSLPNGAQSAVKSIKREYEWVSQFEKVVLMFDNDEAGEDAVQKVAALLPPGKVKIARLPLKDANEMLKEGRGAELVDAFWSAKEWRPDGILSLGDIKADAIKPVERGAAWPWKGLDDVTNGRRPGEVIALGAGTGVGKTDFTTQLIVHDATELNIKCGVLYLEQPPVETARRLAGKLAGRKFHIPDAEWTPDELVSAIDLLDQTDNIVLYNHFGTTDWDVIQSRIRYMVVSLGCRHIFLDHLTALAAHAEDERKELEAIMADIAGMAQELGIVFHFVSHLATPEGKPHEEGGRVFVRHFKGSRAIGFWSHFMVALERNQQAEDIEVRSTTTLRILKDRYTGLSTGFTTGLRYGHDTGFLTECEIPKPKPKGNPFNDTQEDF